MTGAVGKVDNVLCRRACFQISISIRKPDDCVGVAYVDPLRIVAGRVERDAIGFVETRREKFNVFWFATSSDSTEYSDFSAAAFGQENVAVGAVRISRGLSSPVAYCCTLKPAGAFGHASRGRATSCGPLAAESVTYGAGRSCTVILRKFSGSSKRKSVNGAGGGGAFVLTGFRSTGAAPFVLALGDCLSDFK